MNGPPLSMIAVDLGMSTGVAIYHSIPTLPGPFRLETANIKAKKIKVRKQSRIDFKTYREDVFSAVNSLWLFGRTDAVCVIEKIQGPSPSARNGEVRGALLAAWEEACTEFDLPIEYVSVTTWKKAVVGHGFADQDQYLAFAKKWMSVHGDATSPGEDPSDIQVDEAAAVCVAIYWEQQWRLKNG